ncbi:ubiquitin-conjugating enzyme E2 variant 3 [Neolamprologus brichardi]|uniref:ubiquitin-conjugating enzyme E2 variant 3 n=1 Tax=Neolamprologus brichardi TaxID=32507 RepID=UPI0003EC3D13|nr:ubiquitin-conjugating enzyme E2 variant 3 [Neolamprologus brichardi]
MDLTPEQIQRILSKYKFRDVAVEELEKIYRIYPGMKPSTGTYTFSDSTQKDLLKLTGTLPVQYEGRSYNFPIQLWLLDSFPFTPPICHMKPTSNMVIREGKHVDANGRIHLPGLHNWDHPKSSVVGLLNEMVTKFQEDPPLSSKTTTDNKDPHELLAFVSNFRISDGGISHHGQPINKVSVIGGSYVTVVQTNVDLYRGIIPNLARLSPSAVMLIASQPVDIMAHVAWRQSGLPPTHVIGAGCNLDSERLSHVMDINLNTHKPAWVIGELSDNKIAVMSNSGLNSNAPPEIAQGSSSTKPLLDRAFEIMKNRGQRSWSVGLSIADITNSVLTDKRKVHSVSTLAQGWGGIAVEVFLSLPCIMGVNGSTRLAGVSLGQEEDSKLRNSVTSLSNLMAQLRI